MGYVYTTGTIATAGTTGIKITLSGKAKRIYLRVDVPASVRLTDANGSTNVTTANGLYYTTGATHEIVPGSPPPVYAYIVTPSTADKGFVIAEYF